MAPSAANMESSLCPPGVLVGNLIYFEFSLRERRKNGCLTYIKEQNLKTSFWFGRLLNVVIGSKKSLSKG